jgi:DNA replication and repair protein RecF
VQLSRLRVENLRNVAALELDLGAGLSLFVGPNGAGKTSILEGAYLLSHAQSFRSGPPDALIQRGAEQLTLAASVTRHSGPIRIGLARSHDGWQAKVNGLAAPTLGSMLREYALACFEPGSHVLISGGSAERRRFLDWGVFHVEPDFLNRARRYSRALRQRNAALKQAACESEVLAWDVELTEAASPLAQMRSAYFMQFRAVLSEILATFLPELGAPDAAFASGWDDGVALDHALHAARARDRQRGHTTLGPHRADWSIRFAQAPQREHLSRGQEKLCALACVLAQARVFAEARGEWPVIAFDDLASELDPQHQQLVVQMLRDVDAQVLISGIEVPDCLRRIDAPLRVFHVEHGSVRGLL